jgi:hypothetical protein
MGILGSFFKPKRKVTTPSAKNIGPGRNVFVDGKKIKGTKKRDIDMFGGRMKQKKKKK